MIFPTSTLGLVTCDEKSLSCLLQHYVTHSEPIHNRLLAPIFVLHTFILLYNSYFVNQSDDPNCMLGNGSI